MLIIPINDDLRLRTIELSDAPAIFEIIDRCRDHLKKWLPWVDFVTTVDDSSDFVLRCQKGMNDGQLLTMVIEFKGRVVGICDYHTLSAMHQFGIIGYWIDEAVQGNGIMTNAVQALVKYGFTQMGLNRVEIRAASKNLRSRGIPERMKFTLEGVIRDAEINEGQFHDHCIYGILKREWLAYELS